MTSRGPLAAVLALVAGAAVLAGCGDTSSPSDERGAPAGCAEPSGGQRDEPATTVRLLTHDSFALSDGVLDAFTDETGIEVEVIQGGDAGTVVNQALLTKGNPQADVLFGIDSTFLSRALDERLFVAHEAEALEEVDEALRLDPNHCVTPVDYGDVCINYDKAYFADRDLALPDDLDDLTDPAYRDLLVVENPATSSPGLAFMLATIATFGESGDYTWLDFWKDLRANDVLVSEGWEDAYYTQFSASSGQGPRPLVVSYATSPAAEVFFSEGKLSEPPTGNLLAGSFLQVEFAGILKGTQQRALAERLIDFMLSKRFQEDVPLQMFVYPVLPSAALPDVFTQFAQTPKQPVGVAPEQIDQYRERWIDTWTKTVLR